MEIMEVMSQKTRDGSFKQKGVMMSNAVESSGKIVHWFYSHNFNGMMVVKVRL